MPVKNRKALIERLEAEGLSRKVALWMTTNLVPNGTGQYRLRFDLDAIEEMMNSFLELDLWPFLKAPPPALQIDFVRAEGSDGWNEEDLHQLEALERQGFLRLHLLADSAHWVHSDNPEGLLELLAPTLA